MTEHFGNDFDGYAGSECDGGGKGVSANVGGDVFANVGFFFDDGELACVGLKCDVWKMVIVSLQYLDDGRKKRDVILCTGFHTGSAWKYQVSVVVFGFGKIGGHEVRI